MFASVETQTTAKCVAGDADIWSRAVQGSQAELGRPRYHITPEGAGTNPGLAGIGVDLYGAKAGRAQQHSVGERAKRPRIVSSALGSDPLAVSGCGADNIAHLVGALRQRNTGRLLVHQNAEGPVPGPSRRPAW